MQIWLFLPTEVKYFKISPKDHVIVIMHIKRITFAHRIAPIFKKTMNFFSFICPHLLIAYRIRLLRVFHGQLSKHFKVYLFSWFVQSNLKETNISFPDLVNNLKCFFCIMITQVTVMGYFLSKYYFIARRFIIVETLKFHG